MTIRDFSLDDRKNILDMVETFYNSPGVLHKIPTENFANAFNEMCNGGSARLRGLILEESGNTAGFCSLSFSYSTEAGGSVVLIEEIFVKEEYRGSGLGHKALNFIKDSYKGKAARLRLEVVAENKGAIKLYKEYGFGVLPYVQMTTEDF